MKDDRGNRLGVIRKLRARLTKSREGFVGRIQQLLSTRGKVGDEVYEELEEILVGADVGIAATMKIVEGLRQRAAQERVKESPELFSLLEDELLRMLSRQDEAPAVFSETPVVILVVGVNGTGKTTTIAKLAHRYMQDKRKILLAAADTYRAAAAEQLEIWSQRLGADLIKHQQGSDPAAVVYDSLQAAKARGVDYLIIDTAGRLHTKRNLMEELMKIKRVISKQMSSAPHEVLLVLDATTGQNAISQAQLFSEALDVSGIVLAKLDGTAKGGIIVAISDELNIPVKYIGIGETLEDLRPFVAQEFIKALFED